MSFRGSACLAGAFLLSIATGAHAQNAAADADAASWRDLANRPLTRTVSLRGMSVDKPFPLASIDARREFFFRVPANVPIEDATLDVRADYLRGDGGRTTFVVSLDGYPVSARAMLGERGDAGLRIGVDGAPRQNGLVRVGFAWSSIIADRFCAEERSIGNVLNLLPDTELSYSFRPDAVRDLATAWSALPQRPTLLVARGQLASQTYDAAWRVGVALERSELASDIVVLPSVGDTITMLRLDIPAPLAGLPPFAAIARTPEGQPHRIASEAELGALLVAGGIPTDVAVLDKALSESLAGAMDALGSAVEAADPAAAAGFRAWRAATDQAAGVDLAPEEIRLLRFGGRPLIAIAPNAGPQASALFDNLWRKAVIGRSIVVRAVDVPQRDPAVVLISRLGGVPGSMDVLSRGDWEASFDLGALSADGRTPNELALDLSAAPGASGTAPVASVFLNGFLLGAQRMTADGKPERLSVAIPLYSLAPRNLLRVSFQRQPVSDQCRETPQAFPVAVLPTSHARLGAVGSATGFTGLATRLSGSASLIVPADYLADAARTLPLVVRIASATGLSPSRSAFQTVAANESVKPTRPFLAFETAPQGIKPKAQMQGDRLILTGSGDRVLMDAAGLQDVATIEVANAEGVPGLLFRSVSGAPFEIDKPFNLGPGDLAVLGETGELVRVDTRDASQLNLAPNSGLTFAESLRRNASPALIAIVAFSILFVLLLLRANWVRRRQQRSGGS